MGYVYRKKGRTIWMMKYYKNGVPVYESSETDNERKARKLCRARETDIGRGVPVTADLGKLTFEQAVAAITADYAHNNRRSAAALARRIRLHLAPVFRRWKMVDITTTVIQQYVALRRARQCRRCAWRAADLTENDLDVCPACAARTRPGASRGTVNRELQHLKRMFTLAVQSGALVARPHIALLNEKGSVRKGFFEREAFESVRAHLAPELQAVVTFAYVTGWRVDSEVLPLEWRHVDLAHNEVSLDPGMAKNDEPRVFPLTAELRAILLERQRLRDVVAQAGHLCPWVFFRLYATKRGGAAKASPKRPKKITRFNKAWANACIAAGQPDRIVHDFRRTAVRSMVRRAVPEAVAMKLSGHKTRSVFERYNIVSPGDLHDARAKLEGLGAAHGSDKTETPTETPAAQPATGARPTRKIVKKFGGAARI